MGYANSARLPELNETPLPPDAMQEILLPGLYTHWPVAQCRGEQVRVRYRVTLPQSQRVRLLFNTPEPMRLWFDGRGVLKRDGGPFVPAMHRAPEGQITELHVEAGSHDILAVMRRPANRPSLIWCIGLSDTGPYHDWLVGVFDRPACAAQPRKLGGLDG